MSDSDDNNFIYQSCPIYIIWELIFNIIQTRNLNVRYFYCKILSKIAHACTFAVEGEECTIKLIDIQGIDIKGDEKIDVPLFISSMTDNDYGEEIIV